MSTDDPATEAVAIQFADFLDVHTSALLQRWRTCVRADEKIPSAAGLTRQELTDHLPEVLLDVEALLRDTSSADASVELEIDSETHGQERWLQGYSLQEVLIEIDRFRTILLVGALTDFASAHPAVERRHLEVLEHRLHAYSLELVIGSVNEFTEARDTELQAASDELITANRHLDEANSRLQAESEKVRLLSNTDELTGVANRRFLMTRLEGDIALCSRYHDDLAVVMLDLDHFKAVNDTWGHPAGDRVLVAVAEVLSNCCRFTDTVARYGGEEFVLVLPRTSMDTALALLERVRAGLRKLRVDGVDTVVTASFGVTAWKRDADAASMLSLADRGVYSAKASGRDRICSSDEVTRP